MRKPKQPILYISLYSLLKKKFKNRPYLTNKEMNCELGKHFLVPKRCRDLAINELIEMKIITRIDKNKLNMINNKRFESDLKLLSI